MSPPSQRWLRAVPLEAAASPGARRAPQTQTRAPKPKATIKYKFAHLIGRPAPIVSPSANRKRGQQIKGTGPAGGRLLGAQLSAHLGGLRRLAPIASLSGARRLRLGRLCLSGESLGLWRASLRAKDPNSARPPNPATTCHQRALFSAKPNGNQSIVCEQARCRCSSCPCSPASNLRPPETTEAGPMPPINPTRLLQPV